ncbi:MAG: DUF4249 domain-containing protein [Bacteroidetes bacterium]|jgi:hypothetical protein|nr:DUF4249 domain-containing protein [Bacteroidota bacterium]MCA6443998.1 DUF4249 domain-containing protein [Bacteroidota bacterium]
MKYLIQFISLVILFSGCVKDAKVKIPKQNPFIVTHCYISPTDSIIVAKVYLSQPLYQTANANNDEPVTDAKVEIQSNTQTKQLLYNSTLRQYQLKASEFNILPNSTYTLYISLPNGNNTSATTSIPAGYLAPTKLYLDSIIQQGGWYQHRANLEFLDPPNEKNYYAITWGYKELKNTDTILSEVNNSFKLLVNDSRFNGALNKETFNIYPASFDTTFIAYRIYFLNTSYDYYEYFNSVNRNANSSGNPFAEPALVYTNFKNGLGVFAGYTRVDANLYLK